MEIFSSKIETSASAAERLRIDDQKRLIGIKARGGFARLYADTVVRRQDWRSTAVNRLRA
jgi:hypothetical protein